MPKLIFDGDETGNRVHPLVLQCTTVGRSDQNTLTIRHPSVSSFHCELLASWRELIVRDLHSSNGTFVNGECLRAQQRPVKHKDVLRFGDVKARVDMSDAPADDTPTEVTAIHEYDRCKRYLQKHSEEPGALEHATLQLDEGSFSPHEDHTLIVSVPEESAVSRSAGDEVRPAEAPSRHFQAITWIVAGVFVVLLGTAVWLMFGRS